MLLAKKTKVKPRQVALQRVLKESPLKVTGNRIWALKNIFLAPRHFFVNGLIVNTEISLEKYLHLLIRSSGLQQYDELSSDVRTLQSLAKGRSRNSKYKLMCEAEEHVKVILERECGKDWVDLISSHWEGFKLQATLGLTCIMYASSETLSFADNAISIAIKAALKEHVGPDISMFLNRPFEAWVELSCNVIEYLHGTKVSRSFVKNRVCNVHGILSERQFDRWIQGGSNIRKFPDGHRAFVRAVLDIRDIDETYAAVDYLTGWLLLSIGIQSLPSKKRRALMNGSNCFGLQRDNKSDKNEIVEFISEITIPYIEGVLDGDELRKKLEFWQEKAQANPLITIQFWRINARLAISNNQIDEAAEMYRRASSAIDSNETVAHGERWFCLVEALAFSRRFKLLKVERYFQDEFNKRQNLGLGKTLRPFAQIEIDTKSTFHDCPLLVPLIRLDGKWS